MTIPATKSPSIRRLDDNDDLDINLVNTDNEDTELKQEEVEELAEEDLLTARLTAYRETGIDIIKEFTQQLISFYNCSQEEHKAQLQPPHIRSLTYYTLKEFRVLLRGVILLVINKEELMTLKERRAHIAPDWRLAFEGIRSDIKDSTATNLEPRPYHYIHWYYTLINNKTISNITFNTYNFFNIRPFIKV